MEKLVVSLEVAKKLKETGWKNRTHFYFTDGVLYSDHLGVVSKPDFVPSASLVFAPTPQELADELPTQFDTGLLHLTHAAPNRWHAWYGSDSHWASYFARGETLADALALLWIEVKSE